MYNEYDGIEDDNTKTIVFTDPKELKEYIQVAIKNGETDLNYIDVS